MLLKEAALISWTDHKTNEEVYRRAGETRIGP